MKCPYCGGNLSLEDETCPHCGRLNEQARQHVKDMKHYKGEFEHAKKHVYIATNRYTKVVVRVVIIAILFFAIIVLYNLGERSYSIVRSIGQYQSKRHAAEYMKQLDQYIEEEEFFAFTTFCNEHKIDCYEEPYMRYIPVKRTAQNYMNLYENIMQLVCPTEYQEQSSQIEQMTENLDYFYSSMDMEQYEYYEGADSESNQRALETMEHNIILLLQTYFHISEEEAEQLKELSQAKRAVLIEEAIIGEE
ncbi:hypothetical protein NDGK_01262 [Clostridiales bacterium CHKCI001]|nr:hypothetical protein NDGK_01262 [Clostridiales bacterium CHKCI001]